MATCNAKRIVRHLLAGKTWSMETKRISVHACSIRHYHTLDCEGEKRGVSFRICITRHRKEPLHEPLCQIFPERKTVSCLDGIHPGRIPGAVARLSQLLSEADGVLHAEREAARETMLRGILQQSFADDGRQACVYPDVSAQSDYPGYFWRSFQHASTGRQ